MIEARYRRDYAGEFVITETRLVNGVKKESREWVDNPIQNLHTSGRAAVIGSRADEQRFRHQRLERHRGGLLGSKRLQTYGSGDIWQDMRLTFYTSTNRDCLADMISKNYDTDTIVYSNSSCVMDFAGHLYLVPYAPLLSDAAAAVYLASFDGHEEIFLLGYNIDVIWPDRRVMGDITNIMRAYTGTQYISVGANTAQPAEWLALPNFRTMTIRDFVTYCDI